MEKTDERIADWNRELESVRKNQTFEKCKTQNLKLRNF